MPREVSALKYAMQLLSSRDHGREELGRKMARKGVPLPELEQTLARLEEMGLLDDEALVDREIARLIEDGRGPRLIRQRLGARGLPSERIEKRLLEAEEEGRVDVACRSAIQKRFGGELEIGDHKEWARAARFLAGRGFRENTIRRTLPSPR